jgi:hypothetical protein
MEIGAAKLIFSEEILFTFTSQEFDFGFETIMNTSKFIALRAEKEACPKV